MTEMLPISKLVKDPMNMRFDDEPDEEFDAAFIANIKEQGVLQDILVRPLPNGTDGVVIGWERATAAKKAGFTEIKGDRREMTDEEAVLASLSENLMRKDLSVLGRAKAFYLVLDKTKLTQQIIQ